MNEIRTIEPFIRLGERLAEELLDGTIEPVIRRSEAENPWFSRANVVSAIQAICTDMLDGRNLGSWLARYPAAGRPSDETVGIVMAGNIPLVGFFDLLCVLICDRRCLIKPSSKDRVLIGHIVDLLREIEELGMFQTLEKGIFADIKRPQDGGKGLAGVVPKLSGYINPFIPLMKGGWQA